MDAQKLRRTMAQCGMGGYIIDDAAVRLASSIEAEERERCAKMADEYATWGGSNFSAWFEKLAAAIRA
jgi:hypothetical protein